MANPPQETPKLSAHELRALSVVARVHPSTAMRWLAGQRCHAEGAERLAKAAADLGLAVPLALATTPLPLAVSSVPRAT